MDKGIVAFGAVTDDGSLEAVLCSDELICQSAEDAALLDTQARYSDSIVRNDFSCRCCRFFCFAFV